MSMISAAIWGMIGLALVLLLFAFIPQKEKAVTPAPAEMVEAHIEILDGYRVVDQHDGINVVEMS